MDSSETDSLHAVAVRFAICGSLLAFIAGCHSAEGSATNRAESRVSRDGSVVLDQRAEDAIGLQVTTAHGRSIAGMMPTTGWLAVRPGDQVVVKAPTSGFILPKLAADRVLGAHVEKGNRLAELEIYLSPQEQAQLIAAKLDAEKDLHQADATLKLNEEQLNRAKAAGEKAVAGSRIVELQEVVDHARAAEEAARKKMPILPDAGYGEVHFKTVAIESPITGRVVETHVSPRQLVATGDPLWTIADWSRLWIRVPVFVPDLNSVRQDEPAKLATDPNNTTRDAQPVHIPQSVDIGKQTAELIYEIDNKQRDLRPGQSVSVSLPTSAARNEIVVPRSSVLWDGISNSWVYLRTGDHSFRRRKIEAGQALGDQVVVLRGLKKGERVVSTGAEALYSEEFKDQLPAEDKD